MVWQEEVQKLVDHSRFEEAVVLARTTAVTALNTTALIYHNTQQFELAIKMAKAAICADESNALLHSNLAYLLGRQRNLTEAETVIEKAISLEPNNADIYYNQGVILADLGKVVEAMTAYKKAIKLNPDFAIVHFNLGSLQIMCGNYREGLREYEWRFKSHAILAKVRSRYNKPDWDGKANLKGKRLLVYNEQGIGDAMQFCRYAPRLKARGAMLIAEVQSEIVRLFYNSGLFDLVVGRTHNLDEIPLLPEYDYCVSFSSLPYLLDPDLDKIPTDFPYLKSDSVKKLPATLFDGKKLKVGIVWAGSAWHPSDSQRSCPVKHFIPLSKIPSVKLYSLQIGPMERNWNGAAVNLREGFEKMKIVDMAKYLNDFSTTAQVIDKLDLVIAVDTTVAHLAGALGKPVWMLIAHIHDWRWLMNRVDSPWYPNMRLFAQSLLGDWEELITRVAGELKVYAKSR